MVQEVGRINDQFLAGPAQPCVDVSHESASREAYLKLIKSAFELAIHPTMPLTNFTFLVKCQKMNGVRLIDGKDDGKAAGEYIDCIARAVEEKVAAVLVRKNAMSLLSDGSQARKTGADKEMVLIRVERSGKLIILDVFLFVPFPYLTSRCSNQVISTKIKCTISVFAQESNMIHRSIYFYFTTEIAELSNGEQNYF